jgi:hypothetical protein
MFHFQRFPAQERVRPDVSGEDAGVTAGVQACLSTRFSEELFKA